MIRRITDSEMLRIIEKTAGEKFAGVVPTSPAICPTCWLTESNIPERFHMIPLMIMPVSYTHLVEKTVIERCVHQIYQTYFENPVPENMPVLQDCLLYTSRCV